ncbi:DNA helicase [Caulobacter phage C1]|nr:DNA helicase [Caulobacter phage C1]UTU08435.1 DNA helicase [Caulobacter phage C2]UTU08952.1 DNA helicase [Caulobacter phage J4]UTU09510.1 DNA helicase [Caulobacter phage BL47]UTU10068.1 DNA helicase [Caulobacter phage RB23]WGN97103.1 DNA helicase [Bertelyvirus sp.]
MARIDYRDGRFIGLGTYDERLIWQDAGFTLDMQSRPKAWVAANLEMAAAVQGVTWTEAAISAASLVQAYAEDSLERSYKAETAFEPPIPQALKDAGISAFPFQKAGVEYALMRKDTLIGDQPGLGKTIQAILTGNAIGVLNDDTPIKNALVVVPASLKENWRREWEKWQTQGLSVGIAEASFIEKVPDGFFKNGKPKFKRIKRTDVWPDTDVVIINYEILDRFSEKIRDRFWHLLVADEAHAFKSPDSLRTLFICGGIQAADRKKGRPSAVHWRPVNALRRVFLTGTPMLSRPAEFWPIVQAFDPKGLGLNEEAFYYRYCGAFREHHGLNTKGATNLKELGERLRRTFMIRRLKKDVLPELPPKTRTVVALDSAEIRDLVTKEDELAQNLRLFEHMMAAPDPEKVFKSVEDFEAFQGQMIMERAEALGLGAALGEDGDKTDARVLKMDFAQAVLGLDPPAVKIDFEEIALVRRELGMAKIKASLDWIKTFLDGGEKLVVFAYHTDVVEALIEGLKKYDPAYIYGKVPQRDRQKMVDKFQQTDRCRVIIGNIAAMGVGHTLTKAADVAFVELDWTPAMMEQCEDRVCRIGQLSDKIFIYYLVANGSLDARIAQAVKVKEDNIMETIG